MRSTPRQILERDRNIATRVHEDEGILGNLLNEIPFPVDPDKVEAAEALLRRNPLGVERARRLLWCPPLVRLEGRHMGMVRLPCRQRVCEDCAERRARKLAARAIAEANTYMNPAAVLITAPSRTRFDLEVALDSMRENLTRLRRRRWFLRGCVAGVLALEAPMTGDQRRWALHGHGVVDLRGDLLERAAFEGRVQGEWQALTGQPGAVFEVEALRDASALIRYGFKVGAEKSTSPAAWTLTPRTRAHLDQALRGRRLVIAWGAR